MSLKKRDHFNKATGRFQNCYSHDEGKRTQKNTNPNWKNILSAMFQSVMGVKDRVPTKPLPYRNLKGFKESFRQKDQFIWLGHSSVTLSLEGKVIYIDPVFLSTASPFSAFCRRFSAFPYQLDDLPRADYILLSHNHHDHYDEKVLSFYAKDSEIKFIVPDQLGNYLEKQGVKRDQILELDWWESFKDSGITFYSTPALHSSGRWLNDQNKSLWGSWVIETSENRIFFSGDSGYASHFKEIGHSFGSFDYVFLENGQYDKRWPLAHMFPEQSLKAFEDLKGKFYIPIHWGVFALAYHAWYEPVERTYRLFDLKGWKDHFYLCPELGQVVAMDKKNQEIKPWWINAE